MEKVYLPDVIEGKRITLIRHDICYAEKMYQAVIKDNERLLKFLPWPKFIKTVEDEIDFINNCNDAWDRFESSHYMIKINGDDSYIGNISAFNHNWNFCSTELGYWLIGEFEGLGYMSEAVHLLEKILFDANFNRIVIKVDPNNFKSQEIAKRLNYTYEGTLREVMVVDSTFRNLEVYSKLKSEYS